MKQNTRMGYVITDFVSKDDVNSYDIEGGTIYKMNNLNLEEVRALREVEFDVNDFKLDHLSQDMQKKIISLIKNHAHAFSKSYQTLGQTDIATPIITLSHEFPHTEKTIQNASCS